MVRISYFRVAKRSPLHRELIEHVAHVGDSLVVRAQRRVQSDPLGVSPDTVNIDRMRWRSLKISNGTVKLFGVERDEGVVGCGVALIAVVSASRGEADYLVPGGEAGCHLSAVGIGAQPVATGPEVR